MQASPPIAPRLDLYIAGQWVQPEGGRYRDIVDPATERLLTQAAEAGAADVQQAIAAARRAFDEGPWRDSGTRERARWLHRIAEAIAADAEHLATLESLNTGKTISESRTDMGDIAATFRYFAALVATASGRVNEAPPHVISRTLREPVGVCGLITPWNYPLLQAAWKLAPALGAGNTVVLKPSELTPLSTHRLAELLIDIGLPPGVFNLVTGSGEAGAELARHREVDLLSFTGGALAGAAVMNAASGNFKKLALELGGKNPNIVFDDADFDTALDYALNAAFFHAGQVCSAGSRLMVQSGIHDRFVDALVARTRRIRLGNGFADGTQMGPVQSALQRQKVMAMVAAGVEQGAVLRCGGKAPAAQAGQTFGRGFWLEPAVLTNVRAEMALATEEIFGPVLTVERFGSEQEALRHANATPFGLAAAVWTRDLDRANRVSRALRFGTVWANDYHPYFPEAPWGGYKASGIGRELGPGGLDEYTELKHSYINLAPRPLNWFGAAE
ncbi:aldehyde dehydrogenase family protein [Verminephrobacter eiseniae]|uniref:4-(hydroxymethyl)benzenesulfonate dehydrogenase n=1 Tax=Verminephrobacter eiseniae (strain EF01-2) TaxID=391735 RepID=A1WJ85_VEREI|nr:aldehyde dehydrogenase family protein [Verminephrobacter eiseniae]ABM57692.1 aldehyde dehydrogenase (acceptor) [Verminephrobacter eiseniae EF01-2]MCW5283310.1 aldehyde dehydrogenase family protein [Verminephrobacter eiseniae]MCW5303626.1 aldehyde dehydrogenase family protein [Verminephrobacter eiseniae]MCW8178191.1 aldehyde dehydrogenase family protein [Verminephrobacter eiseniae]MCW8188420.1 aldehyde dehydrogenase family protein [Verminephrobacter eiseniae]